MELFTDMFGVEAFVRAVPSWTGGPVSADLFEGLR
jgi:hypothetical protein